MNPMRTALLWASHNEWLADRVPQLGFVKRAVRRFMPGEDLEDALAASKALAASGLSTVLTHLGEHVTDEQGAAAAAGHYLTALDRIAGTGLDTEISVKLTHLGLDLGTDLAAEHVDGLARRAAELGNYVWVDVEDSHYVDATIDVVADAMGVHDNVGVCLQCYLYRTPADIERLLPLRPGIRLVKGAYREPADISYQRKADIDAAFSRLALPLLDRARDGEARVALATHDVGLLEGIVAAADRMGTGRDTYEIQMLFGIRTVDQRRLVADGHAVRTLISYGTGWYPWYLRRLAERPANLLFVARNALSRAPVPAGDTP